MKPKLKPCPFCGGRAKLIDAVRSFHVACMDGEENCILREVNICDVYPWYSTKKIAVKYWNMRKGE